MACIRVIDFETSDMEPPGEVIEVGFCDLIKYDRGWAVGTPTSWLCGTEQPLSPGARAAHHITADEIAGWAPFDAEAIWTRAAVEGVDVVAAHNAEFEGRFWGAPKLPVLCTYKAALRIWPDAPSHSNSALRYWLQDHGRIDPDHTKAQPAHRAAPDAYVTAHILSALLNEATASQMVAWTKEPRLLPRCPLGKFRGKPWPEVDGGFLDWMLRQADMDPELKWNARRELERRTADQSVEDVL